MWSHSGASVDFGLKSGVYCRAACCPINSNLDHSQVSMIGYRVYLLIMLWLQGNTQMCPSVSCRPSGELKGDPLACQQLFMRPYWSEGLVIRKTESCKQSGELKGDPIGLTAVWMCVASQRVSWKAFLLAWQHGSKRAHLREKKGDPLACQQLVIRPCWSEGPVIR